MHTKTEIQERIDYYDNLIDKYSKNAKFIHLLETTRSLKEFWKAQMKKHETLIKNEPPC